LFLAFKELFLYCASSEGKWTKNVSQISYMGNKDFWYRMLKESTLTVEAEMG
jgi:hypothetical protein